MPFEVMKCAFLLAPAACRSRRVRDRLPLLVHERSAITVAMIDQADAAHQETQRIIQSGRLSPSANWVFRSAASAASMVSLRFWNAAWYLSI
jgi:hypothetical protein